MRSSRHDKIGEVVGLGVVLAMVTALSRRLTVQEMLDEIASWSRELRAAETLQDDVVGVVDDIEGVLALSSRLIPGAACLQRALSAQIWLSMRYGIMSTVQIGLRESRPPRGHAWLSVETEGGPVDFFVGDALFRRVWHQDAR